MVEKLSRLSLIMIWFYHGLIPKLIFRHEQEILMNSVFMPFFEKEFALISTGILEVVYALLLIVYFNSTKVLYPSIFFSVVATIAIAIKLPELFTYAFNPISINLSVCVLGIINLIAINESQQVEGAINE